MIAPHKQLKWGVSSMGAPEMNLDELITLAEQFELHGIELRTVNNELDLASALSRIPQRSLDRLATSKVNIASLNSSFLLINPCSQSWQDLKHLAIWADRLSIPYIRVFGGGHMEIPLESSDYAKAVSVIRNWKTWRDDMGFQVDLALETHCGFSTSDRCLTLFDAAGEKLPIFWDSHHSFHAGEELSETWQALQSQIVHVHLKDSLPIPSARHPYSYALPGKGTFPADDVLNLLRDALFSGLVTLEWERLWHPYLGTLASAMRHLENAGWRQPMSQALATSSTI